MWSNQWARSHRWIAGGAGALLGALVSGHAQASASVDAAASYITFPVVAQTASYSSEVTIYNPNAGTANLEVGYVGGNGTAAPGLRTCAPLAIAANQAVQFDVGTQCSLPAGSHFGILHVHEPASATTTPTPVHGYSRVTNPLGLGFSVPAFPVNVFESSRSTVIGLKRQVAAPGYQTNCFVGSVESTTYTIALYSASGTQIGGTLFGSIGANMLVRYLDIFATVGAPTGDYANVWAEFAGYEASAGPPLIAFCTVQDNTNFGADFRIAGATAPFDNTRTHRSTSSNSFSTYGSKHVYELGFRSPDRLRCFLESAQSSALELRVLAFDAANNVLGSWGGNGITDTGVLGIGEDFWPRPFHVEVSLRGPSSPATPIDYALVCESGSGHAATGRAAIEADDF